VIGSKSARRLGAVSRRKRRAGRALLVTASAALVLTGCSPSDIPPMIGIRKPASVQGDRMYSLWQGSWVAAWAIGALVWGLILWAVIAYRRRSQAAPVQTRYNMPIEILYTVVPLFIVMVLFAFTARDESRVLQPVAHPAQTINVVGYRWSWTFNYLDEKVYDIGTPDQVPTLWLPIHETTNFKLTSPDVIHSFWIPAFLMKMDVIPGRTNQFPVTPNALGTFPGRCAELCGVDHTRMIFQVKVVTQTEFDAHIAALRAAGQVGLLVTGRVDNNANGKQGNTGVGGGS